MKRTSLVFALALAISAIALPPAYPQADDPEPGDPAATPSPDSSPTPDPNDPEALASDFDTLTYWKAELPGGTFIVAHDSVNGVSSQEYVLDGTARVTEVNVSTSGVMQPRFYYIEPLVPKVPIAGAQATADRAKSAIEDAASRAIPGDPVWAKVIKTYPTTTHAGTIEYRVETKEQIRRLYKSLEQSWLTGRSEVFRPEGVGKFDPKKEKKDGDAESETEPATEPAAEGAEPGMGY